MQELEETDTKEEDERELTITRKAMGNFNEKEKRRISLDEVDHDVDERGFGIWIHFSFIPNEMLEAGLVASFGGWEMNTIE